MIESTAEAVANSLDMDINDLCKIIDGPKLTIHFTPNFVTIDGEAPKCMAREVCFALAPIFRRHGLALHLSVKAGGRATSETGIAQQTEGGHPAFKIDAELNETSTLRLMKRQRKPRV